MKALFPVLFIFILTSCSTSWDPPPQGYEIYQTRHTNDEQIKRDMIACGFPDVRNGSPYLNSDPNGYTSSVICMEKKGYKSGAGRGGICSVDFFKKTETCQKHLSETQSKQNQK